MTASPDPNLQSDKITDTVISGRSAGGKVGASAGDQKIYAPIAGGTTAISSPFGEKNHGNPPHTHMGIDVPVPSGTKCVAPCDGRIGRFSQTSGFGGAGGMIHFVFTQKVGEVDAGTVIGWGHVKAVFKKAGEEVKGGEVIALSNHPAPHVHFIQRQDDSDMDGTVDPTSLFKALQKGQTVPASGTPSSGGSSSSGSDDSASIARAAALSTFIQLPGIFDTFESRALAGQKSLMNDQPLLPFVEQLCTASLRNFQSMPNGNFFAFFPDYFGGLNHRTPYWEIDDIEIIDGSIDLSDDALATHVFMTGDIAPSFGVVDITDKLLSGGVVTIFNAFAADFITGINSVQTDEQQPGRHRKTDAGASGPGVEPSPDVISGAVTGAAISGLADKEKAIIFLQKYGARPYQEDAPMVRSPFFELFLAYQKFMLLWSQQFLTTFTFTFMPELYPGGIVAFPEHGIQCYIAEVTHDFDFESGFTTQANLMAPASLPSSDRQNVHEGMVRAFTLGEDVPFDPFADAHLGRETGREIKNVGK